jgi:hypothetical protein
MRRPVRRPGTLAASAVLAAAALLTPVPAAQAEPDDPTVVAVGDIACQSPNGGQGLGACRSADVADLIRSLDPDRFLALGDLQYNNGTLAEFERVWDVQFGDLLGITDPTPGNHEYGSDGAAGYFDYFGADAAPPHGYYSFDLGAWHVISLNSDVCGDDPGCDDGTPQHEWLEADLAASHASCTLAFMHHPRYDWRPWQKWVEEGDNPNANSEVAPLVPLWEVLVDADVDVVLTAHNHLYQRWAPQDAHGNAVAAGAVQFTVGTGGRSLYSFGRPPRPDNLAFTANRSFGVLEMTLRDDGYDYRFVPVPGDPPVGDAGAAACA